MSNSRESCNSLVTQWISGLHSPVLQLPSEAWAASNCDIHHVAVLGRLFTHLVVPRLTQPSICPGLVNENQLRLGRQRRGYGSIHSWINVWVKLWNPSTMRAIPQCFCSEVYLLRCTLSSIWPFPFRIEVICVPIILIDCTIVAYSLLAGPPQCGGQL